MTTLNPFLRAFFRSTVPLQCAPVTQHILLVPSTAFLLTHRDSETGSWYPDLVGNEDFLASHVIRISSPTGSGGQQGRNETGSASVRDNRGKAKQYTTLNGRTLVIKDNHVFTNKGFRNLNQAQLAGDVLYYHDGLEAQQWLVYYISKPLLGTPEPIEHPVAVLPKPGSPQKSKLDDGQRDDEDEVGPSRRKVEIKTFRELLNRFPLIARQIHTGMEQVFASFHKDAGRPMPTDRPHFSHSRTSSRSSTASGRSERSSRKRRANGHAKTGSVSSINTVRSTYAEEEEDNMRKALERAVSSAIDLFQQVDKQQLALLGSTTDLTGPMVERLVEKHVAEQVHDSVLFPRLCDIHENADVELDSGIQRMYHVDIGQVGVDFEGGFKGKRLLTKRIAAGVDEFRKIGISSSPQDMIETLLRSTKVMTGQGDESISADAAAAEEGAGDEDEDLNDRLNMTINADALVSLLLIVVIRSNVRHLQARLASMRSFVFLDDVDSGEIGYALSTFEAVLAYLTTDSGRLRVASRRNKKLWQSIRRGNLSEMRTILEPDNDSISDESDSFLSGSDDADEEDSIIENGSAVGFVDDIPPAPPETFSQAATEVASRPSTGSNLSHVFPFERQSSANSSQVSLVDERPKPIKRVSWSQRSFSNASEYSFGSRASTVASRASFIEGDTSIEKLCQTQDHNGNTLLMMAIQARQPESLAYLLSLEEYFSYDDVLDDRDADGATLLSAAVQSAQPMLMGVMVDFLFDVHDLGRVKSYIAAEDIHGRSMAHYLFHAPELMSRFADLLPWRKKDKNGQTPLLALCRSYDHQHYIQMVNEALQLATDEQADGEPLHVDNHVDKKGNTILHVVSEALLALRILQHCDVDPNAANEKKFTPLMVASKFGRFDLARALFLDKRVDYMAKEYRGMTAVELAKDDDVRNRIDDMVLVSNVPSGNGRVTAVVRAFFMDDGNVRLVIKSATRTGEGMISVTTCRRSLSDFEQLAKWLAVEHPSSWIPAVDDFRVPYQIPSRPSRAVMQDIYFRLDKFLRNLLEHPTFSNHELVWEFILTPEIQPSTWAERSTKKAEIAKENIHEEYEPLTEFADVENFAAHARESLRSVSQATRSAIRRTVRVRNTSSDMHLALQLLLDTHLSSLPFLPPRHKSAFDKYVSGWLVRESDPVVLLHSGAQAVHATTTAMLTTLTRPLQHIVTIKQLMKALEKQRLALRRADQRWGLPLLLEEGRRKQSQEEGRKRVEKAKHDILAEGAELRHTQQTVAQELATWHDHHARVTRRLLRGFAEGMLVRERERLEAFKRALRTARQG